jgi:hypothetical protein
MAILPKLIILTRVIIYLPIPLCKGVGIARSVWRRATGWKAGVRFSAGATFLSSQQRPDWLYGPPRLLPNGYLGLFPLWAKRSRRETYHSPHSSAKVKNGEALLPVPHISSERGA